MHVNGCSSTPPGHSYNSRSRSSPKLSLLERILDLLVLAHPDLLPLLRDLVLDEDLPGMVLDEPLYEARIPQFTGDAEVLTATHHGVGLAALGSGGNPVGGEIVLLAAGNGDESI